MDCWLPTRLDVLDPKCDRDPDPRLQILALSQTSAGNPAQEYGCNCTCHVLKRDTTRSARHFSMGILALFGLQQQLPEPARGLQRRMRDRVQAKPTRGRSGRRRRGGDCGSRRGRQRRRGYHHAGVPHGGRRRRRRVLGQARRTRHCRGATMKRVGGRLRHQLGSP